MNDIVQSARGYLGTPFRHQARSHEGVDCIGLVIGTARDAGLGNYDFHAYAEHPNPRVLLGEVERNLIQTTELKAGSILLFRILRDPQHFGIYTGPELNTFIHAYAVRGKVIEDVLDDPWRRRLIGIYEYKAHYG